MLRTTISSMGARGAIRIPVAMRSSLTSSTTIRTFAQRSFTTARNTTTKPHPSPNFTFTFSPQARSSTILQRLRSSIRYFNSSRARRNGKPTSPNPTPNLGSPNAGPQPDPTTLSGRLKKLSREYGWSVMGVYLILTALDFPFCYLFVLQMGTDRIGEWEHAVLTFIKDAIPDSVKQTWRDWRRAVKQKELEMTGSDDIGEAMEMAGWGVEEASEANKGKDASLATQLALAYAIHKAFIFIRVPLTIAITPKVVKMLRGWGWEIGKRTTKEAKAIKRAAMPVKAKKA